MVEERKLLISSGPEISVRFQTSLLVKVRAVSCKYLTGIYAGVARLSAGRAAIDASDAGVGGHLVPAVDRVLNAPVVKMNGAT